MLACKYVAPLLPAAGQHADTATPGRPVPILYKPMQINKLDLILTEVDSVYAILNLLEYLDIPSASTQIDDLITGEEIEDFHKRQISGRDKAD